MESIKIDIKNDKIEFVKIARIRVNAAKGIK